MLGSSDNQCGTVRQVVKESRNYGMTLCYDPVGNRNRCFYQCLSKALKRDEKDVMHHLECYMLDNETIPTMNENNEIVETSLYEFLTDADYQLKGCKRPSTWRQAVLGLRDEMACHPVILAAATLFRVQINIIDWIGVS
ncbi:hypothetical protein AC249_AIPGENE15294 [Exaiptasia diaphana]|nr:hypothetical protein AC249_AIPGENE15294 [Exaiptasia diaphana]